MNLGKKQKNSFPTEEILDQKFNKQRIKVLLMNPAD